MRLTRAVLRSAMRAGTVVLFHPGGDVRLLAPIFTDFGRGAACGMDGISSDGLAREQDQTAWQRRIFFREGYAFGNALAHAATRRSGNPEGRNRATADYRIMQYTGYGFWNGFARSLHLPVVDEQPQAWRDVADYPALRPFLAGGRSFALMVRTRTITPALLQSFEREATPALARAAWHGCGRALWFRAANDPTALARLLETYPPATEAMTLGLGVAMTLTQIAAPAAVVRSITSMPGCYLPQLRIGAGVALAAMIRENGGEESRVRAMYTAELAEDLDLATWANEGLAADADWYPTFVSRMMSARAGAKAASDARDRTASVAATDAGHDGLGVPSVQPVLHS